MVAFDVFKRMWWLHRNITVKMGASTLAAYEIASECLQRMESCKTQQIVMLRNFDISLCRKRHPDLALPHAYIARNRLSTK